MNRLPRLNALIFGTLLVATSTLPLANTAYAENIAVSQGASASINQGALEQMLAPIALYPDSLLTHILIASTYPLEVVQAQRWLNQRKKLPIEQVMQQAEDKDWDPSVKALLAFASLLQNMSDDLNWTQNLGEAFLADEGQVMEAIQSLRQQADNANNLNQMNNMAITRANKQIIIEPVQREIVYVPYYDPRIAYGTWRWRSYPPVYWDYSAYIGPVYRPRPSLFYWSPGIHISFNYFFSSFHWHSHKVVVIDHQHSHRYRPRDRYSVSYGAKPWKHKPEHRRGVGYHNAVVKQRYPQVRHDNKHYRGKEAYSNGNRPHLNRQYAKSNDVKMQNVQGDKKHHAVDNSRRAAPNQRHDNPQRQNLKEQKPPVSHKIDSNLNARDKSNNGRDAKRPTQHQQTQAQLQQRRTANVTPVRGNDAKATKEHQVRTAPAVTNRAVPVQRSQVARQEPAKIRQNTPRQVEQTKARNTNVRESSVRQHQQMARQQSQARQSRGSQGNERRHQER